MATNSVFPLVGGCQLSVPSEGFWAERNPNIIEVCVWWFLALQALPMYTRLGLVVNVHFISHIYDMIHTTLKDTFLQLFSTLHSA